MQADHEHAGSFWRGRRVLLTGHTGFKGAWLWLWLRRWGRRSRGYALAPASDPEPVEHREAATPPRSSATFATSPQLRAAVRASRSADRHSHGRAGVGQGVLPRSARDLRHQCARHRHSAAGLPGTRGARSAS